ncbi:hypothetical protein BJX70DRAFT_364480 [Aspergillus crustosus]
MTSHGVSRHGRYERLLKRHRLETHEHGHESTLDDEAVVHEKRTRERNLHDKWVEPHEKRQVDGPSATIVAPNPQTAIAADSDPLEPTTTDIAQSQSSDSYKTVDLPFADEDSDTEDAVTAVTTVTTTISWPPESQTESAVGKTTVTNFPEAAIVTDAVSDEGTTESPAETSTATTEPSTESATDVISVTGSLSEVAGGIATPTLEDNTSSSTQESPDSISTSSKTAPATTAASLPIIGQYDSDESNISLSSSMSLPTAIAVPNSSSTETSSTSTQSIIAGVASESSSSSTSTNSSSITSTNSSSSGDTNTDSHSTTTATTSLPISITNTTTTTTSSTSTTSETSSSSGGYDGYGWGGGNGSGETSTGGSGNDAEPTGAPDSTAISSDSGSMTPQTTGKIVGGVVGGVAGASLIFLLIFFFLRRRRKTGFFFGSPARSIAGDGGGGLIQEPSTRQMVSRDSNKDSMFGAAYFAPAFMKRWRQSDRSNADESFMGSSPTERSFQKVSGRKLPSGTYPDSEYSTGGLEAGSPTDSDFSPTLPPPIPRSAFPQPPPSNPFSHPLDATVQEDNRPVMRPSPARIPTSGSANATNWAEASARAIPISFPMPPSNPAPMSIPKRPDALGRSHPSYDGSRGSRFSENL